IVTVDNGIAAHSAIQRANELGIDVVVTDHHEIEAGLPKAHAVVNPKRDPEDAPFAKLCGAALAWKLACALLDRDIPPALAAIATIADAVPLQGENRTLVAR